MSYMHVFDVFMHQKAEQTGAGGRFENGYGADAEQPAECKQLTGKIQCAGGKFL